MFTNRWIQMRENLLPKILRVDPSANLNSPAVATKPADELASPAGELKKVLNCLKAEAITTDGRWVNYSSLAGSPVYQKYRSVVAQLNSFDYRSLKSLEEQLSFWINLYNALVIDAVIQEQIQESVTESWLGILAFFQKAAYQVNGQRFSLTDIEHGVLRANRGFPYYPGQHFPKEDPRLLALPGTFDPRIHFALNCASLSCPPIAIYSPDRIHQQLDLATHNFINGDSQLDMQQKTISISKIFSWYESDFGGKQGVSELIAGNLEPAEDHTWDPEDIPEFQLKYHRYEWGLNKIIQEVDF